MDEQFFLKIQTDCSQFTSGNMIFAQMGEINNFEKKDYSTKTKVSLLVIRY